MKSAPSNCLLAHPFRSFFLATGVYGVMAMAVWLGFFWFSWPVPVGGSPFTWHSHEMLYGLVSAATAGFLLTAMCNWTGAKPLQGRALLAFVLLWVAGRCVMWLAGWLPLWLVAVVDLAFLLVLVIYVAFVVVRYQNRRNYILVAVVMMLFIGNSLMHYGAATGAIKWLRMGQQHGLDVVTLMMIIVAGRITPSFTANWLKNNGDAAVKLSQWAIIERLSLASVALLLPLGWFGAPPALVGAVALLAGALNAIRLVGWRGWCVLREPLLWILHLAYLWIIVALLLRGASGFVSTIPPTVWQHAMGVGAIASLILGVMTRVTMGHTGRPLKLLRFAVLIYMAISFSAVARVLVAAEILDFRAGTALAGGLWMFAFGLFVALYAPALTRPRVDGRPG